MSKIFISYRRSDAGFATDRLYEELKQYVKDPDADIFLDVDNIPPGVDFEQHLRSKVEECDVLFAVIGQHWLEERDETGTRRIDRSDDFVRIEVETALMRDIRVVPILLGNCTIPSPEQLPDGLKKLSKRQGVSISRANFSGDVRSLLSKMGIRSGDHSKISRSKSSLFSRISFLLAGLITGGVIAAGSTYHLMNQREAAVLAVNSNNINGMQKDIVALEDIVESQLELIEAFDPFEKIVQLEYEVNVQKAKFEEYQDHYRRFAVSNSDENIIEVLSGSPDPWSFERASEFSDWKPLVESWLQGELDFYTNAIDVVDSWQQRRALSPPLELCLPRNPFRPSPNQPDCAN